jgi:RNA polymerase sigma-70 factor (ECF subfamily)
MHLEPLKRHAQSILGDEEDAADLVQDTVIRAYGLRESLQEVKNPVAYLFRMVGNAAVDMRRRRNVRENAFASLNHATETTVFLPREVHLIREEERQWVRRLLDLLPEEQAEVIRLRFSSELGFAEIAEITEVPVATVKSRFSYGMSKLRTMACKQKEVKHEL